jgi:hypothetical protein
MAPVPDPLLVLYCRFVVPVKAENVAPANVVVLLPTEMEPSAPTVTASVVLAVGRKLCDRSGALPTSVISSAFPIMFADRPIAPYEMPMWPKWPGWLRSPSLSTRPACAANRW